MSHNRQIDRQINQSGNRRNFLKFIAKTGLASLPVTALLSSCTHQRFYNPDQDIILGGGSFKQNNQLRHVLAVANLQQKQTQLIDLDYLTHGIIVDPGNKNRLISFEKNGRNATEINLAQHSITKKIPLTNNKNFCGHGAFNKAGDTLFIVETDTDSRQGTISIRDGHSLEIVGVMSTYGANPHQCQLIDEGSILVVTNTGDTSVDSSQSSVTYIDVQTQKLVERITLDNKQLHAGHASIADNGSLIVTAAPGDDSNASNIGGVSIRSDGRELLSMTQPKVVINQMMGEALSITIDNNHDVAAVTHPDANLVTFWSIEKRTLVKAISVPKPQGITLSLDEKFYIISYHSNTSIALVSTKDLTADASSIMQPSYITGEHIYNWSKILTEIMPTNIYT